VSRAKLTVHFNESDHLAGALLDVFDRHALQVSVLLRGSEGFRGHLHTDRLLSLSEDLPLVAVAVDETARIEAVLDEVQALRPALVTLDAIADEPPPTAKLTLYVGRREAPALGVALNATTLIGVDGTRHGVRRRARLLAANADVPAMVVAIGDGHALAATVEDLGHPLHTFEPVSLCEPGGPPPTGNKVTIYAESPELVPRLRAAGAAGATALRGHGDRFWSLRRRVATVTLVIDDPANAGRWWPVVRSGLVTSETTRLLAVADRSRTPPGPRSR
jgi:PII-like signaling protein